MLEVLTGFAKITRDSIRAETDARRAPRPGEERLRIALRAARSGDLALGYPHNRDTLDDNLRALFGLGPGRLPRRSRTSTHFYILKIGPGSKLHLRRPGRKVYTWIPNFELSNLMASERWFMDQGEVYLTSAGEPHYWVAALVSISPSAKKLSKHWRTVKNGSGFS